MDDWPIQFAVRHGQVDLAYGPSSQHGSGKRAGGLILSHASIQKNVSPPPVASGRRGSSRQLGLCLVQTGGAQCHSSNTGCAGAWPSSPALPCPEVKLCAGSRNSPSPGNRSPTSSSLRQQHDATRPLRSLLGQRPLRLPSSNRLRLPLKIPRSNKVNRQGRTAAPSSRPGPSRIQRWWPTGSWVARPAVSVSLSLED